MHSIPLFTFFWQENEFNIYMPWSGYFLTFRSIVVSYLILFIVQTCLLGRQVIDTAACMH